MNKKHYLQTKDITKIGLFAAMISIGAWVSVPIGPIPFTLQNFFIFMAGLLLPPVQAFLSVFVYIVLGLIGLPIFSGFKGGLQTIWGPTFGFLIAFAIVAWFISLFCYGSSDLKKIISVMIIAEILTYLIGLPYMYFAMTHFMNIPIDFQNVITKGMIPFLLPDLIKLFIAAFSAPKIFNGMKHL